MAKQGDIYMVSIPCSTGHEMCKDRPGVIISCDKVNALSGGTVLVAFTSTSPQYVGDPFIAPVRSTGAEANAIVYKLACVDVSRLKNKIASCTRAEMRGIFAAVVATIALDDYAVVDDVPEEQTKEDSAPSWRVLDLEKQVESLRKTTELYDRQRSVAETRLGVYQDVLHDILKRLIPNE